MAPRDGSNIYHRPPGTDAVPDTTIESSKYNAYVADVEQDLNLPRPIVAGGTGANNALQAMQNLGGEIAKQVVTNYDMQPWANGSFYSAAGATSAPNPTNRFAGIYYGNADDSYATVQARDQTTGILYVRNKIAGVWGAWAQQAGSTADLDAAYVNVAGDTMTGRLDITMPDPILALNKVAGAHGNAIYGTVSAVPRWVISPGNSSPESGGNAGSDFSLSRYSDAGAFLGTSLGIVRSTGAAQFESTVAAGVAGITGSYYFGNSGTKSLTYNGADYTLAGGGLYVNSPAVASGFGGVTGTYYFGNTGTKYLNYDGTNFSLTGGPLLIPNPNLFIGTGGTTGNLYFGPSGTKYLNYDGTNFNLTGGNLFIGAAGNYGAIFGGDLTTSRAGAPTTGYHFFGNSGGKYLGFDGSFFKFIGANVVMSPWTEPATLAGVLRIGFGTGSYAIVTRPQADASPLHHGFENSSGTIVGSISTTAAATAFNTSSSAELKEDLKSFDAGNIIDNTNVYDFKWKSSSERGYGVLAQQAVEVYPTAVTHTINPENKDDEFWGVDYSKYVPVLLQELKALRTRVAELEGRLLTKPA